MQGLSPLQKTKQSFDWQLDLVYTSVRPLSDRCTGPEDQSVAIKLGQPLEINYFLNQKWSRTQNTRHIILCSDWYVSALIYDFCYPSVLVNNFLSLQISSISIKECRSSIQTRMSSKFEIRDDEDMCVFTLCLSLSHGFKIESWSQS